MTIPIHRDCVGCLTERDGEDASTAVLTLLYMLITGDATPESVKSDLCFEHRRRGSHDVGQRAGGGGSVGRSFGSSSLAIRSSTEAVAASRMASIAATALDSSPVFIASRRALIARSRSSWRSSALGAGMP